MTIPIRVALDMRPAALSGTGIARYATRLADALDAQADVELHRLHKVAPEEASSTSGRRIVARVPVWLQVFVPVYCAWKNIHVFHGTNFVVPLIRRYAQVATVHDLTVISHPHLHTARNRLVTGLQMRAGLRQCDAVITDSQSTARALTSRYPWLEERIHVVLLGVSDVFRRASDREIASVRQRYGLSRPYVLFVGHQEPRKNVRSLIEAVGLCHDAGGWEHELVLVGRAGPETDALRRQVSEAGLERDVRFLGMVADADLPVLLSGAVCFVYPSITEGFGLPVLEAMACGTPVVTTGEGALSEVAGTAAHYARSPSAAHLAEAMLAVLSDPTCRGELAKAGVRRAEGRTWARVAEETTGVYAAAYERWASRGGGGVKAQV